ncbi:MAG: hypothetical protein QGI26_07140, partial [Myxococcota bacterium]|nr:hypothetical protein [Myxococcota bacterium]
PKRAAPPATVEPKRAAPPATVEPKRAAPPATVEPKRAAPPATVEPVPAQPATVEPVPAQPAGVAEGQSERVGFVMHYWDHVNAAAIRIEHGQLRIGDTIHVRGHTTDYYQQINRLELDRTPIESAGPGQEIGVHVSQRVREGDSVYKVS